MPYIEDKELLEIQSQIEKERAINNRLLNQIKIKNEEYKNVKSSTRMIKLISLLLGLAFFSLAGLVILAPNFLLAIPIIGGDQVINNERELFNLQDSIIKIGYKVDSLKKQLKKKPGIKTVVRVDTIRVESNTHTNKYAKYKNEYDKYFKTKNVYSVQIGAFKKRNLLLMSKGFVNFKGYQNKDYFIYSLGNFATKIEAESFKRELAKLGFKDAFIIPYKF